MNVIKQSTDYSTCENNWRVKNKFFHVKPFFKYIFKIKENIILYLEIISLQNNFLFYHQ